MIGSAYRSSVRAWDRAMRWFMHPLFDKLALFLTIGLAAWAISAALGASGDAKRIARDNANLAQENARITAKLSLALDNSVKAARDSCKRQNDLRESAALLLEQQINTTDRLLRDGLGLLEQYRDLTLDQQRKRRDALKPLKLGPEDLAEPDHKYRIDCVREWPHLEVMP